MDRREPTVTRNDRILSEDDPVADIVVCTLNWSNDHPRRDDEAPNAQLRSRVFVNGEEVKFANGIDISAAGGDFVTARIHVAPGTISFKHLDEDEFYRDDLDPTP